MHTHMELTVVFHALHDGKDNVLPMQIEAHGLDSLYHVHATSSNARYFYTRVATLPM